MIKRFLLLIFLLLVISLPFGVAASGEEGWTLGFEALVDHSLLPGGGIAIATGNKVLSLDKDGNRIWEWQAAGPLRHITSDATGAVFAAFGTTLVKLDAKGKIVWAADTFYAVYSLGTLPGGLVVAGYEYGVLAFDEKGENVWEHYAHEECDT